MAKFKDFITENIAPADVKRIGIYNSKGDRVGFGPLGTLNFSLQNKGAKLYSFGALSDVHVVYSTATEDFQKALTYLKILSVLYILVINLLRVLMIFFMNYLIL